MKFKYAVPSSLVFVILAHISVLAAVIYAPKEPTPIVIEPPTIQGIIVASEPITKPPEPTPPPPPEQKPVPVPKTLLPKAPPSERAIQQDVQPPAPTPPVEQPLKEAEPTPAPVVPPQADASELNNPAPVYPSLSKRLNESGTVLLEVLVKADGSLGDIRLKTSSGYSRLDEAALRAIKNWHFVPATRDGKAIDYWYDLPIEFTLNH